MCKECDKFENAAEINHEKYLEAVARAERAEAALMDVRVLATKAQDVAGYPVRGIVEQIIERVGKPVVAKAG